VLAEMDNMFHAGERNQYLDIVAAIFHGFVI